MARITHKVAAQIARQERDGARAELVQMRVQLAAMSEACAEWIARANQAETQLELVRVDVEVLKIDVQQAEKKSDEAGEWKIKADRLQTQLAYEREATRDATRAAREHELELFRLQGYRDRVRDHDAHQVEIAQAAKPAPNTLYLA